MAKVKRKKKAPAKKKLAAKKVSTPALSKAKAAQQSQLAEPKLIGKHQNGNDIYLKNGRFGPYLQYEIIPEIVDENIKSVYA